MSQRSMKKKYHVQETNAVKSNARLTRGYSALTLFLYLNNCSLLRVIFRLVIPLSRIVGGSSTGR